MQFSYLPAATELPFASFEFYIMTSGVGAAFNAAFYEFRLWRTLAALLKHPGCARPTMFEHFVALKTSSQPAMSWTTR